MIPASQPEAFPLLERFPAMPGARSVIQVLVEAFPPRVAMASRSCGPSGNVRACLSGPRSGATRGSASTAANNDRSIDGLPALAGDE